ncbi:MAG: RecQ family ATP-dependent DNA helicase, partial [Firmicutes bacterium]|nr:RecQ family ATP-dependent DNA helicase [Bacillota bacterium]
QIPAMMMPGVTLIISPLISLMKDQVGALVKAGIPAAFINGMLTPSQLEIVFQRLEEGRYKLIYVAPERLVVPRFLRALEHLSVSFVAVDEAHCVSQWGHDFRSAYLTIRDFIEKLPRRPVVGAFTATATEDVRDDIEVLLGLKDPALFISGFDRPNLFFDVRRPQGKFNELLRILEERRNDSGIIYCATRKLVEEVSSRLNLMGYDSTRYHAGLSDTERKKNQDDFIFDRKPIMVATNAFGMGIDKSNVSFVIHYNMPKNMESYYQEAGRAGRDGEPADCILLYEKRDIMINRYFIDHEKNNDAEDEATRKRIHENEVKQLDQMVRYCTSDQCLRHAILSYFGETAAERCENCGNCNGDFVLEDQTSDGFKIISCVEETEQRFGATLIADILKGSKNKRIRTLHLDRLSCYASLSSMRTADIKRTLDDLIAQDYLYMTDEDYPIVGVTQKGYGVLNGEEKIILRHREEKEPLVVAQPVTTAANDADELFEYLRQKRNELALKENVPAYVIFSNATLRDMSRKKPTSEEEMLSVSGVGMVKMQRYGMMFINEIRRFLGESIWEEHAENDDVFIITPNEDSSDFYYDTEADDPNWTDEDDGKLLIFLDGGWGIEAMAEYFLKTPDEIFQRLKDLGMIRKPLI